MDKNRKKFTLKAALCLTAFWQWVTVYDLMWLSLGDMYVAAVADVYVLA